MWTHWIGSTNLRAPSSCPDLLDWRDRSEVFEEYGYFFPRRTYNMGGSDLEPQQVLGGRMSASLLPMLRVSPVLGRNFLPEEDVEGARTVAMLTYGLWRQQFGGDPDIIGKSVRLDQVPYEIVGVLPEEFHIESPAPRLWVPVLARGCRRVVRQAGILAERCRPLESGNLCRTSIGSTRNHLCFESGAVSRDERTQRGLRRAFGRRARSRKQGEPVPDLGRGRGSCS